MARSATQPSQGIGQTEVQGIDVTELEEGTFEVDTYPNPFTEIVQFKVSVDEDTDVSLKVYDVSGLEIHSVFEGVIPGGQPRVFEVDGTAWAQGVYVYQLSTPEGVSTGRFMKVVE